MHQRNILNEISSLIKLQPFQKLRIHRPLESKQLLIPKTLNIQCLIKNIFNDLNAIITARHICTTAFGYKIKSIKKFSFCHV